MSNLKAHPSKTGSDVRITTVAVDETTRLSASATPGYSTINSRPTDVERQNEQTDDSDTIKTTKALGATIWVLMIGVFVSQADTSLVLATYGKISSEFNDLESGSWLLSSYMLAMCVSQPLFGKFSDIFGRKNCLQAAYVLFACGTLGSGIGQSMAQVISARAVQGLGGAGMVCMVSILLTDLLPFHEVALYRSYVNVAQTVGRMCGGVVGGYLASTIGWRWAFLVQIPPVMLSIALVQWNLKVPKQSSDAASQQSLRSKFSRIDFVGALLMSSTILSALFTLNMGGQKYAWTDPILIVSGCVAVVGSMVFLVWERSFAKEPIFPVGLLTRSVVITSYSILLYQNLAQTALMFIVPIYFQVTKNASTAQAGAYLVPAVIGNTVGGLLTGAWIKRQGLNIILEVATTCSALSFTLLLVFWRGDTTVFESFLIMPAGFATGVAHSAVFVGLTSAVQPEEVAIVGSGLYLSGNIGGVTGVSGAAAAFQIALQMGLKNKLEGRSDSAKIIRKAMSDIYYIRQVPDSLRTLIMPAYISATQKVFMLCLAASLAALVFGVFTKERNLLRKGS
ncbi:putative major facilitator superfamily transporter [Phaeosphaeria sp. MPI-PUGE-AT-0046c]|nr:putative major facilitator superfamily transporter [Phaeosphaeria sp. MPI-PUGE-AT-0046c]